MRRGRDTRYNDRPAKGPDPRTKTLGHYRLSQRPLWPESQPVSDFDMRISDLQGARPPAGRQPAFPWEEGFDQARRQNNPLEQKQFIHTNRRGGPLWPPIKEAVIGSRK